MPLNLASDWWMLVLLGLCGGVVSGTLGLGSGLIFVPAMVLLFSLPQKSAQGTALAVMVPMALIGAIRYWLNPDIEVNLVVVVLIAVGAVAAALIGTELASRLPVSVLRKLFAVFLVLVAVRMFLTSAKAKQRGPGDGASAGGTAPMIEKGPTTNDRGQ